MTHKLSHVDEKGEVRMVDISDKPETLRRARAGARIYAGSEAMTAIVQGTSKKGDILATARVAGILAAKQTSALIPLCHPLSLTHISIEFDLASDQGCIHVMAEARTNGATGVEMEALTAVTMASLTIYDMLKAVDRTMRIDGIRLIEKTGGKSEDYRSE